jgi:diguanylate cyclase (GGDEF)-like protein/PAS domain S-box-containing protein
LGVAFAVLIALLAGIGQFGLRRMQTIDETRSEITGRKLTDLNLARKALTVSDDNSRITMEIVLVENRALVNTLLAVRSENSKEITSLVEESERRCESEKEKQLLSEVKKTRQPYVESSLRAIHLIVDEGKHDEAEAVIVEETIPALHKYHAAWEEFVEFQSNEVDVAAKQAQVDYSRAHRLVVLLVLLAVAVALVIARFATRQAQRIYGQEISAREVAEVELQRSDERMRMAVEAARIGFWDWDVIRDEQVWSDTCKELLGLRPESTANFQVLMNSVHPDDRKMMGDGINAAIAEKRDYGLEFRVVWPDGSLHWQAAQGRAFYDETGHATRMAGISMGIDERKHTEERLHWQVAALEAAANAIVITDSHGTIVWVNHAFTTMTGYSKEEALGNNPRLLKSGKQPQSYYADLWSTILSGKVWHGELINSRKDGTTYTEEMTITPVTRDGVADDAHFVAIMQDVTERKRAERATNLLAAIVNSSEDAIISKGLDGIITSWNNAAEQMLGYTAEEAVGQHITLIIPADRRDEEVIILERLRRGVEVEHFETCRMRKDGTLLDISLTISPIRDAAGRVVGASKVARDITERKLAEEAVSFKNALLEAQAETTIDGILVVDESDHIVLANEQFGSHFGIPNEVLSTRDDVVVRNYAADQMEDPEAFVARVKYLNSHRDEKSRDELRLKNGKTFDRYSAPLVDSKGRYRGRIWYFRDITDRKVAEEQVQFLAFYDALTGLPNRRLLQDRLNQALASAHRQKNKLGLLFLDLDRFKDINDSLGHSVGDLLLQKVAERLKTSARAQDTVARLGGDEFLIALTHVKDTPDAAVAAERLMDAMTAEFVIEGHTLNVSCSIGISIFPEHGADCETLIKNADAAMYSAKADGRSNVRFFTEDMNAQAVERVTLESGLRSALAEQQLFLMYQPQMDIATRRITGLEALLRWQHPELGLVPPDKFIQIAENSGLIVPIGEWVLRTACSEARKWQDEGFSAVTVAVNVSAVQFRQENFGEVIRKVLRETGLPPQRLELELTESLLLTNADLMLSVIQELKSIGVTLAIDDFGTGYSSFNYLRQFQISKLKIDRSFIRDVAVNPGDAAITAAIISMAKSLHLKVIAEGVEDEGQMAFLREHQCDEIQGYYFSKPLAVDKVADKLRGAYSAAKGLAQASGKQA